MKRQAVGALILEAATGVAAQTSGIGGPGVTAGAIATVFATSAYLFIDARRPPLSERIRQLVVDRRATEPPLGDVSAHHDHQLDAIEIFEKQFGRDVRTIVRRLRIEGVLGRNEERNLGSPDSLGAIGKLADRLYELGY